MLRNLGYADPAADEAVGYMTDIDYLQYIDEHDRSPTRWRALAASQPPALLFWYRQSPRRLVPIGGTNIVTPLNPPTTRSGMVSLTLDRTGRLVSLLAVPAQTAMMQERSVAPVQTSATDWTPLFAEAGLPIAQFSPAHAAMDAADLRGRPCRVAGRVSRSPRCADSDRSGGRPGKAGVLRDRRAVDPSDERRPWARSDVRRARRPPDAHGRGAACLGRRRAAGAAESASGPRRSPRRVAVEPLHSCRRRCEQCARNRRPPGAHQSSAGRRVRPGVRVAAVYRARATHPADLAGNHDRMEPIAGGQRSRSAGGTRRAGRCAGRDWQRH